MKKYIVWNIQKKEIEIISEKEKELIQSISFCEKYYLILGEEVVQ
jgi:hypothetical protein